MPAELQALAFASCSTFLQFVCGFACPSFASNFNALATHVSMCVRVCLCCCFFLSIWPHALLSLFKSVSPLKLILRLAFIYCALRMPLTRLRLAI